MKYLDKLIDWWRGYTDADVESLQTKWAAAQAKPPGSLMYVTPGENKALCAGVDLWGKCKRPRWTITLTTVAKVTRDDA